MQILGLFMCVVGLVWGQNSTCDDIDSDVCQTFNAHVNVCSDPCLSKLCPRTCNMCPRKCYSCDAVSSLSDCNTTQICPDANHDCFVHKGLTSNLAISYNMGCAKKDVCSNLFVSHLSTTPTPSTTTTKHVTTGGSSFLVGRRKRHGLNGACCSSDLCNKYEPSKKKRQMTSSLSRSAVLTTLPTQTTTLAPGCHDIDTLSCQKLAHLKRDLCNDDCLLKACPRTCGKCSECYSCNFVQSPENCTSTSVCLPAEKCYAVEEYLDSGKLGYRLGCLHENVCEKFHKNGGKVFGRRSDHVTLTLDGDCCVGDLCNHRPLVHTTTTTHAPTQTANMLTTTPQDGCDYTPGHQCPKGFSTVGGKCLMIGTNEVPYDIAKRICHNHCSRLMENISMRDVTGIHHLMDLLMPHVPPDRRKLTVGAHTDFHHRLVWDYSGHVVQDMPKNVHDNNCVFLPFDVHHHGYLKLDDCSEYHYFICEAHFR
ncbi:uncharacterized protein LOC125675523 [Ostrea edulis]|uniref:uncharacterized protein LOC125675523 n=1 Tax=Ostrea edulis TaxID=37623 RepID=UPI0024AF6057|nr:uncharacterized protein LOC125675523 [Ostrea edulis]